MRQLCTIEMSLNLPVVQAAEKLLTTLNHKKIAGNETEDRRLTLDKRNGKRYDSILRTLY